MKCFLFLLVLLPVVFSASLYSENVGDKRLTIDEIIQHLHNLDLADGCVDTCEKYVPKFWTFLCSAACKIVLARTGTSSPL